MVKRAISLLCITFIVFGFGIKETKDETYKVTEPTINETINVTYQTPKPIDKVKEYIAIIEDNLVAQEQPETQITISFAGDCTLGTDTNFSYINSFPYRFEKVNGDYSYFFSGVKEVFENDDLTLVNLEGTFTNSNKRADKKFAFKGDPSFVKILKEGNIEIVNISNNHIYDYGGQGFKDTIGALENEGILYSGENNIAYYETKGIKIASIGYQGWSTYIKENLKKDITKARENADIVIVSFHWGQERKFYPNDTQTQLGRYSIDVGADVVIGHHPHVVQGIEEYKGKYIVYSLGNFSFGGNRNPSDKDTFIFQNIFTFKNGELIDNDKNIIACSLSSTSAYNDYRPIILDGDNSKRVLDRIYKYSERLKYGISR